ncbi:MAG TPA: hypothetical protein VIK72_10560 [Clostridiaceae bacterium]
MNFILPKYKRPDFSLNKFISAKVIKTKIVEANGIAPYYSYYSH